MKNIVLGLMLALVSCSTSKKVSVLNHATPQPQGTTVEIIGAGQKVPDGAKLLGTVKIGDSGMSTNCSYQKVIENAQEAARAMGGNLLQITKHTEPDLWSTCHRIAADVYLK